MNTQKAPQKLGSKQIPLHYLATQAMMVSHCQVAQSCLNFPLKNVREREGENLALR